MIAPRLFLASLAVLLPTVAFAAQQHSMEDQMACTPDVYRLCAAQIPDEDAIVVCLKQHLAALSPECHQVFSRPDNAKNNQSDD